MAAVSIFFHQIFNDCCSISGKKCLFSSGNKNKRTDTFIQISNSLSQAKLSYYISNYKNVLYVCSYLKTMPEVTLILLTIPNKFCTYEVKISACGSAKTFLVNAGGILLSFWPF